MIGKNIQEIRKIKGLSLSECAHRANISKSYLSSIERNLNKNPSIHIVEKIAHVLGVSLQTILEAKQPDEFLPEYEWLEFIAALKQSGIEKDQLSEYKTVIEFVKWKNENTEKKG